MTDFNLKAGNLKKILATFMAVCLTVLSVNMPVMAATEKTDDSYLPGTVTVTVSDNTITTSPNGAELVVEKITVGDTVLATTELNGLEIKDAVQGGSSLNCAVQVAYPENAEKAVRVIEGKVVVAGPDADGNDMVLGEESFKVTQGYLVEESYDDTDDVVIDGKPVSVFNGDPEKPTVTNPNGYEEVEPEVALDKDQYAGDLVGITTDLDAKGKDALKADAVKVTVYDGLATKTSTIGSVVAVYQVKAGAAVQATTKVEALKTNYVEGKVFDKFVTAKAVDMKGKKITQDITELTTEYTFPGTAANDYVIATYKDAEVEDNLSGSVTIQKSKKATVQATFPALAKGDKIVCTVVSAADGTTENDKEAKKILKSVKANVKSGTITFSAGKSTGKAIAFIKLENKKAAKSDVIGTYEVTVQDGAVILADGISLSTNTGATKLAIDKTSASKTAQLVAAPATTGIKYVVTAGTLTTGTKEFAGTSAVKDAKAFTAVAKEDKTKAVSVTGTGKLTAKKVGNANVYAVQTTKTGKGADTKVTVVVSNAVNVSVKATAAGFKFTGGKTFTYKTAKTPDGYTPKKNTNVKFNVKVTGESTDKVAVRAVNMDGKVVLNALNRATKTVKVNKVKTQVFVENAYYNTVFADYTYTADDNLIVVATAPTGSQQYKQVRFEAK